jgi:hypothetical protein
VPDARASVAALLARPWAARGLFALATGPGFAAQSPLALARAPFRLGEAVALEARWPGGEAGEAALVRLAVAARQEIWRGLRNARGLAPVAMAAIEPDCLRIFAAAAFMDGARAAPHSLDALSEIFHDDAVRRWGRWAGRVAPR